MTGKNTSFHVLGGSATDVMAISIDNFMKEYPIWKQSIAKKPVALMETIVLKPMDTLLNLSYFTSQTPRVQMLAQKVLGGTDITKYDNKKLMTLTSSYETHVSQYLSPSTKCVLL